MDISVFGLGYVGCVTSGCLSKVGYKIIGVDVNTDKLNTINSGKPTVVESGLDELIKNGVNKQLISTSLDVDFAISNSDIAIVCVGTPNDENGFLNMNYIENVINNIALSLRNKNKFFTISIRSTVNPGTNQYICSMVEKISGKKNNIDFGVVSNPEFLREGSAISDFFNPPYTVLASSSEKALNTVKDLYSFLDSPIEIVDIKVAELIKFINNSFHALKVAFGNELGRISSSLNLGDNRLIELFLKDKVLNISEAYFNPGFSYGGSCLPKDLKGLNSIASDLNISLPILGNVENSNTAHTEHVIGQILKTKIQDIGIYGLAFKKGTDDLRFSKSLELCEQLLGKGKNVNVFDNDVNISKLIGANKEYLKNKIPHINKMLVSNIKELCDKSRLIVLIHKPSKNSINYLSKFLQNSKNLIIDLSLNSKLKKFNNYNGCNW